MGRLHARALHHAHAGRRQACREGRGHHQERSLKIDVVVAVVVVGVWTNYMVSFFRGTEAGWVAALGVPWVLYTISEESYSYAADLSAIW